MNLRKEYPADATKSHDGVWIKVEGGASFKLTYYNSTQAQLEFQSNIQKNKAGSDKKGIVINAMHETLIEDIVLDWKDLEEDSISVVYSKDECRRLLETYVGLDTVLANAAGDIVNFKRTQLEEISKNS